MAKIHVRMPGNELSEKTVAYSTLDLLLWTEGHV